MGLDFNWCRNALKIFPSNSREQRLVLQTALGLVLSRSVAESRLGRQLRALRTAMAVKVGSVSLALE